MEFGIINPFTIRENGYFEYFEYISFKPVVTYTMLSNGVYIGCALIGASVIFHGRFKRLILCAIVALYIYFFII